MAELVTAAESGLNPTVEPQLKFQSARLSVYCSRNAPPITENRGRSVFESWSESRSHAMPEFLTNLVSTWVKTIG